MLRANGAAPAEASSVTQLRSASRANTNRMVVVKLFNYLTAFLGIFMYVDACALISKALGVSWKYAFACSCISMCIFVHVELVSYMLKHTGTGNMSEHMFDKCIKSSTHNSWLCVVVHDINIVEGPDTSADFDACACLEPPFYLIWGT